MAVLQKGFKNTFEGKSITGFQIKLRNKYYRGVYLSLVERFEVMVDGVTYSGENIKCSFGDKIYTQNELEGSSERWQYSDPAELLVSLPGGLKPGMHNVEIIYAIRISYMPFNPVIYTDKTRIALTY